MREILDNLSYSDYIENLQDFLLRMEEIGYEVSAMWPAYEGRGYDLLETVNSSDLHSVARQALNYEHSNIQLSQTDDITKRQIISVMLTGDTYCDIVPINDWTVPRGRNDDVKMFVNAIRGEILGEDA
jgi:hypothetical protein